MSFHKLVSTGTNVYIWSTKTWKLQTYHSLGQSE